MARVEMTLNKALARKKKLQEQLDNLRNERMDDLVAIRFKHKQSLSNHMSIDMASRDLQSKYDSTIAILNNYLALTMAINKANNETEIMIGDQTMTIALAITYKNILEREKTYWKKAYNSVLSMQARVNMSNEDKLSSENMNRALVSLTDGSEFAPEKFAALKKQYIEDNEVELYDPMNVFEKTAAKIREIEDLEENINEILTIANCNTVIVVDFED